MLILDCRCDNEGWAFGWPRSDADKSGLCKLETTLLGNLRCMYVIYLYSMADYYSDAYLTRKRKQMLVDKCIVVSV